MERTDFMRMMNFEHLAGIHRQYVERKLRQRFLGLEVNLLEELDFVSKNNLSTDTTKNLSDMADAIYSVRARVKDEDYAVKLSNYTYCLFSKGTLEILPADIFLVKLEKLLDEAFDDGNRAAVESIISFIHERVEYFQIGSPLLIKLYRLEETRAHLFGMSDLFLREDNSLYKSYAEEIETSFNQTLNVLEKNTSHTVRVWLLRELYYFHSAISECSTNQEFLDAYKALKSGDEMKFRGIMYDNNIDSFGCTNPDIYLNAWKTFRIASTLPKLAKFNALLNLSHCNGTMATKYIRVRHQDMKKHMNNVIDFLDGLSNGEYTKDIPYQIYKRLGVLPKWFVA
jgi:hypothetical protein